MSQVTRTTLLAHGTTDRTRRWVLGSLVAVVAGATVPFGLAADAPADEEKTSVFYKGKAAPDIALKTLAGADAKLSDQKGKVVVVDFWATWCIPCRKSLPHINALANKKEWQEKGLVVWAVNLKETEEKVKAYVDKYKYTFTVLMDVQEKAKEAYAAEKYPTTLVIGRDGKVAEVFEGETKPEEIDAAIEKALQQK